MRRSEFNPDELTSQIVSVRNIYMRVSTNVFRVEIDLNMKEEYTLAGVK